MSPYLGNQLCDHRLVGLGSFLLAQHPLVTVFPCADGLPPCSRLPRRKRSMAFDGSEGSKSRSDTNETTIIAS